MSSRRNQSPRKKCSCDDKYSRSSCRSYRCKRTKCTCETCEKHTFERNHEYSIRKHPTCCSCKECNYCHYSLCKYPDKSTENSDCYNNNDHDEQNKNIQNIVITIKHCQICNYHVRSLIQYLDTLHICSYYLDYLYMSLYIINIYI